jgi:hypothetical protein
VASGLALEAEVLVAAIAPAA